MDVVRLRRSEAVLERIIGNHINQLEDKNQPREYKILLYNYTLKFLKLSPRNEFAGKVMSRLYQVANKLDGVDSKWREVKYNGIKLRTR